MVAYRLRPKRLTRCPLIASPLNFSVALMSNGKGQRSRRDHASIEPFNNAFSGRALTAQNQRTLALDYGDVALFVGVECWQCGSIREAWNGDVHFVLFEDQKKHLDNPSNSPLVYLYGRARFGTNRG